MWGTPPEPLPPGTDCYPPFYDSQPPTFPPLSHLPPSPALPPSPSFFTHRPSQLASGVECYQPYFPPLRQLPPSPALPPSSTFLSLCPLPPGVDRYPPLYDIRLPQFPPLRPSPTSPPIRHSPLESLPLGTECRLLLPSPDVMLLKNSKSKEDDEPLSRLYDKINRSLRADPPPSLSLIKNRKYRTAPTLTKTISQDQCDLIFMIKWISPATLYKHEVPSQCYRYEGEDSLKLRIHFMELVKPALKCRRRPPADGPPVEYTYLLPLFKETFSGYKENSKDIQEQWETSFCKHLNHAPLIGKSKGLNLNMKGCAEFMVACNFHFEMPYLLLEMRKNALAFAKRETEKEKIECECEEVTIVGLGVYGKYRMRARYVWKLMRDILGPFHCPAFNTKDIFGSEFLYEVTLYVNKNMQPVTYKKQLLYPVDNRFVIF